MSPEQAQGETVDRRSDIWAFGCCLFECLSGQRAFSGGNASQVLASVLRDDPDWSAVEARVSPAIIHILRRCLQKAPGDRLRDANDLRLALVDAQHVPGPTDRQRVRRRWVPWASAAGMLVLGLGAGRLWTPPSPSATASAPTVFEVILPSDVSFAHGVGAWSQLALSPDGRTVVWAGREDGVRRLYRRAVDDVQIQVIDGTEGGTAPFFSPEGEWIAFFTSTELRKVPTSGGTSTSLAPVTSQIAGHWSDPEWIHVQIEGSWRRVPAQGGQAETVVDRSVILAEEEAGGSPFGVLAWSLGNATLLSIDQVATSWISIYRHENAQIERLIEGVGVWTSPDASTLLFGRNDALLTIPFDIETGVASVDPRVALRGISRDSYGHPQLAIANDGTVAWIPQGAHSAGQLVLVNRAGQIEGTLTPNEEGLFRSTMSPDSKRLAVERREADGRKWSIVLYDLERGGNPTVVSEDHFAWGPVWAPDSRTLYFASFEYVDSTTANTIYQKDVDSPRPATALLRLTADDDVFDLDVFDIAPNGRDLVYGRNTAARDYDLWVLDLASQQSHELIASAVADRPARVSPDGRWLVYQSGEGGEIFVRSFPDGEHEARVSTRGGSSPEWSADGESVFYLQGTRVLEVPFKVDSAGRPQTQRPEELFSGLFRNVAQSLEVDPNGDRFVLRRYEEQDRPRIRVHRHLLADLW
jgi:Tol biopolymer transport system component